MKKLKVFLASAAMCLMLPNMVNASPAINVADVQKALNDFGYTVKATGNIDEDTKKAIIEFQKAHNLKATGELDNDSYQVIMGKDVTKTSQIESEELKVEPLSAPVRQPTAMEIQMQNIISYAQQFEGVPYVWGGSSPNGFDCSGFVQYVYAQNGIQLPRTADYQANVGQWVDKSQLQPGDLVFFAGDYVNVSHVGIYVGDGKMIHASSGKRRIDYDDLSRPYRVDHYHSARRVL